VLIIILTLPSTIGVDAQTDSTITPELIISPLSITARMNTNGSTSIYIHGIVTNQGDTATSEISYRIESLDLRIISVNFNGDAVLATISRMERHSMILITLSENLESGFSGKLDIEVISEDIQSPLEIATDGESMEGSLVYYMRPHVTIANFTFTAILPEYASLSDESLVPIFPNSDSNYTNGKSLIFVWNANILQPGQERAYIIRYQVDYVESIPEALSPLLVLLFLVIGIGIGSILTFFWPRIASRIKKSRRVEYLGITSEEEEILDIVREKGGSCSQKELYRSLPISESKVSLLLGNLEERGVIQRFREGRENMVHLIE